ncbi:MAG: SAM-dependent methyltransferase [Saprospiraceae bacterium]
MTFALENHNMKIEKYRNTKWFDWIVNASSWAIGGSLIKEKTELLYWQLKKWREGTFNNDHYEPFYTTYFNLDTDFYTAKKIMDIGCGPRGSLEWATMAAECIGLDPLSDDYLKMGADKHRMKYINSGSEAIPFEDNYFDVVTSFNSLDHVDDLNQSIVELTRVLKPNGLFLFIADIHEKPTITEPSAFSWDIMEKFKQDFIILDENHYEGHQLYTSIRNGIPFDHSNIEKRYGVLTAKLQLRESRNTNSKLRV